MITINLLPASARKAPAGSVGQLYRTPLVFLLAGILMAGTLALWGIISLEQLRLSQLAARLKQLEPKAAEANRLAAEVRRLKDQQTVYQRVNQQRSQWARRLNALSDRLPDGVWLTELDVNPATGLRIQGLAVSQGGEEMVRIERFVKDLKADAAFSTLVRDLQIKSVKSLQEQGIELIEFALAGEWSAGAGWVKP